MGRASFDQSRKRRRVKPSSSLPRLTRVQKRRQLGRRRDLIMVGAAPYSQMWGYVRIITGTILGGILGFYVMHHLEVSYNLEKMKERLRIYEMEMMRKEEQQKRQGGFDEFEESVS